MVQNAEADGKARLASEDDPRILPIGRTPSCNPPGRAAADLQYSERRYVHRGSAAGAPGAGSRAGKRNTGIFLPPAGQSRTDRLCPGIWKIQHNPL
ncbi:MAG: hypothetical protein ACLTR6_14205 [Clostridium fessum]